MRDELSQLADESQAGSSFCLMCCTGVEKKEKIIIKTFRVEPGDSYAEKLHQSRLIVGWNQKKE
jgi:hypothetical protein